MKLRVKKALEMRRLQNDDFRAVNGYGWDFVMVFRVHKEDDPLSHEQRTHSMKKILAMLSKGGLETRLFYSVQVCSFIKI